MKNVINEGLLRLVLLSLPFSELAVRGSVVKTPEQVEAELILVRRDLSFREMLITQRNILFDLAQPAA